MSQKLPVNDFKWVEERSRFNEDFIKIYNLHGSIGYFIVADVQYPENLHKLNNDLPFCLKESKSKKLKNLKLTCVTKKNILRNSKQTLNKKNDKRFNNCGYSINGQVSEASVNDSKYIKMTELQDFY